MISRIYSTVGRILAVATIAVPLTVGAATSDVATGVEGESAPNQLLEIIVTAQKRTEDIKDIPFSVSAISGTELAEHHVANYDDITRTVPGIGFQAGPGPGLDNIEIRGVSSTSGSATVGIYIDEVSVTVSNSLFDGAVQPKLFDLERIEVLRGPQGTLYGASSMGGTIRFITKQPDLNSFSATVSTDLSGTRHGGFNNDEYGILNIPVIDGVFALRIGVDLANDSGYIDHYIPAPTGAGPDGSILELGTNDSTVLGERGVNDVRTQVFRVVGKYAAPDDWTITPAYLWQRVAASDTNIFYPDIGLYDQDKRVAEPYTDDLNLPSLTVTKSFSWAELTSVTSYFKRDFRRTTDGTLYNSNIFANSYVVGGLSSATNPPTPPATAQQFYETQTVLGFLASPAGYDARTEQFSEELRLSSKSTSIAGIETNWTAGLYFANQRRHFLDDEYIPGLHTTFQKIYGYGIYSPQSVVGPSYYAATAAYPAESFANDLIYYGHLYPKPEANRAVCRRGIRDHAIAERDGRRALRVREVDGIGQQRRLLLLRTPGDLQCQRELQRDDAQVLTGLCAQRVEQSVCDHREGISSRRAHRSRARVRAERPAACDPGNLRYGLSYFWPHRRTRRIPVGLAVELRARQQGAISRQSAVHQRGSVRDQLDRHPANDQPADLRIQLHYERRRREDLRQRVGGPGAGDPEHDAGAERRLDARLHHLGERRGRGHRLPGRVGSQCASLHRHAELRLRRPGRRSYECLRTR